MAEPLSIQQNEFLRVFSLKKAHASMKDVPGTVFTTIRQTTMQSAAMNYRDDMFTQRCSILEKTFEATESGKRRANEKAAEAALHHLILERNPILKHLHVYRNLDQLSEVQYIDLVITEAYKLNVKPVCQKPPSAGGSSKKCEATATGETFFVYREGRLFI